MSRYEWEHGRIIIPANQWSRFRTDIITSWNNHQAERFKTARAAFDRATTAAKGLRGAARHEAIVEAVDDWELLELLGVDTYSRSTTMTRPLKKHFLTKPISRSCTLRHGDWYITLDNETRTLRWCVNENNHAVSRSHNHPVVQALFSSLSSIQWTKNTGGSLVGNDEYNDFGNYITAKYGPGRDQLR